MTKAKELHAKAGSRKLPSAKVGKHLTNPEARKEGRYCAKHGLSTAHLKGTAGQKFSPLMGMRAPYNMGSN